MGLGESQVQDHLTPMELRDIQYMDSFTNLA